MLNSIWKSWLNWLLFILLLMPHTFFASCFISLALKSSCLSSPDTLDCIIPDNHFNQNQGEKEREGEQAWKSSFERKKIESGLKSVNWSSILISLSSWETWLVLLFKSQIFPLISLSLDLKKNDSLLFSWVSLHSLLNLLKGTGPFYSHHFWRWEKVKHHWHETLEEKCSWQVLWKCSVWALVLFCSSRCHHRHHHDTSHQKR